ncbi:sensor domain-containing diguanylate cyclase [Tardiphaga alba]|uniref:diguanylate cyclase n=1 Tax=Tardiphaga alba TaxID=340268 RepID=A0ABX8ABG2_9BRAD|nr:sensor domain-containing diguanylate cyclase [Tardiphaga alba]QUS39768.1 sensor domain-containing diguanylate cyclase [Tardiphaga alba]
MQVSDIRESERLTSLDSYDILDTPPEEAFDRITRLARHIFDVPMSTISLIDGHRQWFKSRQGFDACETSRDSALCNFTIRETAPLIIPDALADPRFRDHPAVVGDPHVRFYAGAQLRAPGGHAIGTLCAFDAQPRDVSAAEVAMLQDLAGIVLSELELRALVMQDSLTGALSRRALRDEATRGITLAVRHGHSFSVIMFDLDHFKAINDNNGHDIGDRVLAACVKACQNLLRKADAIGRVGGEEFAIVLPHTNRADAQLVAEKVREAIAGVTVMGADGPLRVSASLGIATLERTASDIDELLRRADAAMYEAKQTGRNRCIAWRTPEVAADLMRRVFKAGHITFNAGHSTIDCTVRGLSEMGASIDVFSTTDIPERFKLSIPVDHLSRACHVLGKREKHLDVVFD